MVGIFILNVKMSKLRQQKVQGLIQGSSACTSWAGSQTMSVWTLSTGVGCVLRWEGERGEERQAGTQRVWVRSICFASLLPGFEKGVQHTYSLWSAR